MRKINLQTERDKIKDFINSQLSGAGLKNIVVGISGGIDSAVTLGLCVEALGKEHVFGFMLPYRLSHENSLAHGKLVAEKFGVSYRVIDISTMVDSYFDNFEPDAGKMRLGNRMARERMCILYDQSAKYNALVAGTGNKSELLTGYMTQYGDGACAFEPLGHLYKTEVYQLAQLLGVPAELIDKKPTADLWEDQTDEGELGMSYLVLDQILYHLFDQKLPVSALEEMGLHRRDIKRVIELKQKSEFKRNLPPQIEVSDEFV